MDSSKSSQCRMAMSCKHGNTSLGSIKDEEFFGLPNNYQLTENI